MDQQLGLVLGLGSHWAQLASSIGDWSSVVPLPVSGLSLGSFCQCWPFVGCCCCLSGPGCCWFGDNEEYADEEEVEELPAEADGQSGLAMASAGP